MVMAITKRRKEAGLTQVQLAAAVGVNQSSVSQWESGASVPKTEILPILAKACKCTIDDLFDDDQSDEEAHDGEE